MLVQCPQIIIDPIAYDVFAAADLARHGSWPVAGGWLDQVASLRDAIRIVWNERTAMKLESFNG